MIPVNIHSHVFGTVAYWRDYRRAVDSYKARTWKGAMIKFARVHGKAIAMLADDSALILERANNSRGYVQHYVAAENMCWHDGNGESL